MAVSTVRQTLELQLRAEPQSVREARDALDTFLKPLCASREEADALRVAISEACANAVCHGSPDGTLGTVRIRFEATEDYVWLEVVDQGPGFQPERIALPRFEDWQPSGRGLFLMQALMDELVFDTAANGTRVRMSKCLRDGRRREPRRACPTAVESMETKPPTGAYAAQ